MNLSTASVVPPLSIYINRELSLLEFQRRVLEEAQNEKNPLLERVKFLSIFGSNMDEFFMIRVSGIIKQVELRILEKSPDGLTPPEALVAIRKQSLELYNEALSCYQSEILPQLDKAGIHVLNYGNLNKTQKERINNYFSEVIFPVLTPLALDPDHPFPHISNLSLNLAIIARDSKGVNKFARLKVPDTLPRLVPIKRSSGGVRKNGTIPHQHYFVWIEQVIAANLKELFPGMKVIGAYPFRIVRDADVEIQELEADDLLETIQQSIRKRKFGSVVQVSVNENMSDEIRALLLDNLLISPNDLFVLPSPLGLASLMQLYNSVDRTDLKYPLFKPAIPKVFKFAATPNDIFEAIQQKTILLHHPYDSFSPVVDFLFAAARDPNVLAIKQTLYRVGQNSPIVDALLEASEHGKEVAVLVELKARFDEESNIGWARKLEQAGVHVIYGLVGLKTHCKVALVIRKEGTGIRRYLHLATGNYNPTTARCYEDIGLFTCDENLGADATDLFNYLTGYSTKQDYRQLLVAPLNLRNQLVDLIQREIGHARAGLKTHIIIKVNGLTDPDIINLLYLASQAGVKIDLLIRGICCLRPGVKGLSESISVISVVGQYLEHSRIFYFLNGGQEEIYLGSADLMQRNLNQRVEVVFPIKTKEQIRYLRDEVLESYLHDNSHARILNSDGKYLHVQPDSGAEEVNVQNILMNIERNQ